MHVRIPEVFPFLRQVPLMDLSEESQVEFQEIRTLSMWRDVRIQVILQSLVRHCGTQEEFLDMEVTGAQAINEP